MEVDKPIKTAAAKYASTGNNIIKIIPRRLLEDLLASADGEA